MNKVIIFGGEHYNALGLARVFGVNNIFPDGILIIDSEHPTRIFASKSKYWNRVIHVKNEDEGIQTILKEYSNESEKPVLVPSSDKAELLIDQNKGLLETKFIVPGFKTGELSVRELMNKNSQAKWAKDLGLLIAQTWELSLSEDISAEAKKINKFPCILKPVLSSEGKKTDITKCDNMAQLIDALLRLENGGNGYKRILVQEFISKEYEMELFGSILSNSELLPYFLTKHLREWPVTGGSVSCHEFITDEKLRNKAENILQRIRRFGYSGNIDIELFKVGDEVYLNEVNFRNSGDVYTCFENRLFYPYIWYLDAIGQDVSNMNVQYSNKKYAMNETTDFRHVLKRNIKFKNWLKYYKNCGDFAYRFHGDMIPFYRYIKYCFSQFIKGKRF